MKTRSTERVTSGTNRGERRGDIRKIPRNGGREDGSNKKMMCW